MLEKNKLGVGGGVGAGAVVISGTVHGSVTVTSAVQQVFIDKRCVAQTLELMERLDSDQRLRVLKFMEREFGTQMVKELSAQSQLRVRQYVMAILNKR